MTRTVQVDLPLLLPQVRDSHDQCVERLRELITRHRGIQDTELEEGDGRTQLHVRFDPQLLTVTQVERLAREAGARVSERYRHEDVRITDMDCADCASSIEHVVGRLPGVVSLSVSYAAERMRVEYDARQVSREKILDRVGALGYEIQAGPQEGWLVRNKEVVLSVVAGLLLSLAWLGERYLGLPRAAAVLLYLGAYAAGGYDVARHGLGAARELRLDIDVLMIVAAVGAAALGRWAEGALLLFLFSLGHALERYAMGKARRAIRGLQELAPKTALVLREGQERELPVREIERGDLVIVRPGQRVPVDGRVRSGGSAVNEAPITGEGMPVEKASGDEVFAGTVNGPGLLEVQVTKLAGETLLARVVELVEEAQVAKAPSQRVAERFTRFFVPAVLLAAAGLIVIPPLVLDSPFAVSFLRAMALLVAASPCALGIATPSAVLASLARAARSGVLVKGGAYLERLAGVEAVAFDKTGTLTEGRPRLTHVLCQACFPEDEHPPGLEAVAHCGSCRILLSTAAALESRSGHPLAQAVVEAARQAGVDWSQVGEVQALAGRGLRGALDGETLMVGSSRLFEAVPPTVEKRVAELEGQGRTTMLVRAGGRFLGVLALADEPRPEAARAIRELKRLGVRHTLLLTGDNERTAAAIAREVGLDGYRAGLLPEDKVQAVRELLRTYRGVAMIGDGVNDAPALAAATVGIAMGGARTDVALETADAVLMGDDLSRLPFLLELSKATRRRIVQNMLLAGAVIALLVPAAVLGLASIGEAILLHEGSTLAVVLNALRLLRKGG